MKRWIIALCAALACTDGAWADWGSLHYGGYQPWWNIFAKRNRNLSAEEERLQRFWHDYYDALRRYYGSLDHIDWVAYYKNHGYQINSGCGAGGPGSAQRVQFAPVIVSPTMNWAVPTGNLNSPPPGPACAFPGGCPAPGYGAAPVGYGAAPAGYGAAPMAYGMPLGYGTAPMGYGATPASFGGYPQQ